MSARDIEVVFEAELSVTIEEPYDSGVVLQVVQDEIGYTGVIVTDILIADGATDL